MNNDVTLSGFLDDVRNHEMTIKADTDEFRSLTFSHPKTNNKYFNITTWGYHLCISGDMGTYVFSRLNDMFDFFRSETMYVNHGYWGEKLEAISKWGGQYEFCSSLVVNSIRARAAEICEQIEHYVGEEQKALGKSNQELQDEFLEEIDQLISFHDFDEYRYVSTVEEFHSITLGGNPLLDDGYFDWLQDKELSYQYQWCCFAIVWAIKQYDRYHNPIVIPSHYQALQSDVE